MKQVENIKFLEVLTKKCTKCKEEKEFKCFNKDKSKKDGYYSSCKKCVKEYYKQYQIKYKDKLKIKRKVSNDKTKEYRKQYYSRSEVLERMRNRFKEKMKCPLYKEDYDKKRRIRDRERIKNDPIYKARHRIKSLLKSIKNKYTDRENKIYEEILGCTYKEFCDHINNNPYGHNLLDSNLDIDHIIPISFANSLEELLTLSHYSNLQLLDSYYNRHIKRANVFSNTEYKKYLNEIN